MLCSKYGFEGLELNLAEVEDGAWANQSQSVIGTALNLDTTEAEWEIIAALAQKYNVKLPTLSCDLLWRYPLTNPDTRERGMSIVRKQIDAAAYLGCATVLVVPGLVTAEVGFRTAYTRAVAAIRELEPYAAERDVILGIENVPNKFLLSPLEMVDFIDEIASPHVQAYLDIGNMLQHGYPQDWICELSHRVVAVHAKDIALDESTVFGKITGFPNLLKGNVPWREVSHALKQIGYTGFITAELHSDDPHILMPETSSALDEIIN